MTFLFIYLYLLFSLTAGFLFGCLKFAECCFYFSPPMSSRARMCELDGVCEWVCVRVYSFLRNPSKLIIISKHDRMDKMSCAPPDLLSNHKPYLRWWTDVALARTNQSLSVRVGVHVWHTGRRACTSKGYTCRLTTSAHSCYLIS